ncbi:MAG: hypothetical protein ACW98D_20530 [Promethearchaeota archaeon]|jgi:hypothetical protein
MVSKLSITKRMIPLYVFLGIILILNYYLEINNQTFDYWASMINFPEDLISWFFAGFFVVLLFFFLAYVRAKVTQLSFSDLKRDIPHSDRWENIQFIFVILNILIPIGIGLLFTFLIIDVEQFVLLLNVWLLTNFLPDTLFYLYWLSSIS